MCYNNKGDMMKKIKIGTLTTSHGLKGEVKVMGNPEIFHTNFRGTIYLSRNETIIPLQIAQVREIGEERFIVKFKEFSSLNEIENFQNLELLIDEADLPALKEEEYYHKDLIGKIVVNQEGIERGIVSSVVSFPQGDYLEVMIQEQKKLVPFRKEFVVEIQEKIMIHEIEGLL